MEKQIKTSTDPQENEINSNYLGKLLHWFYDNDAEREERVKRCQEKPDGDRTLDELQDPAHY